MTDLELLLMVRHKAKVEIARGTGDYSFSLRYRDEAGEFVVGADTLTATLLEAELAAADYIESVIRRGGHND